MTRRNDFSLRLFISAGITEGMSVLDVGCGPGEITQLVRQLVGAKGKVTGIDLDDRLLKMAEENNQHDNVDYRKMNVYQLDELEKYDAIVGRRVLMYLPDAVEALVELKKHLKFGGIIAFQESDAVSCGVGAEDLPVHQQMMQWIWETVEQKGGNIHIGSQLFGKYIEAGFEAPEVISEAVIQTTASESDLLWLIQMMEERIVKHGVAIRDEIKMETLKGQMEREKAAVNTSFIRDMSFGVWSRN